MWTAKQESVGIFGTEAGRGPYLVRDEADNVVAIVGLTGEAQLANLRLILSAPLLLEAVRNAQAINPCPLYADALTAAGEESAR